MGSSLIMPVGFLVEKTIIMRAHAESLQLCLALCDPADHSPPGFSDHRILQARILEWVAVPSSRYVPDSTQRTGECQSFSTPQAKLPTSLFKLVFSHRVCVCVCVCVLAIQLCPTLCNALDCRSSGRYVLKIL